jgi:hypothetical protein
MKTVHIVVGVIAIVLNGGAALYGGWCWWRVWTSRWFWRVLRAGQAAIVVQVALGGILVLIGYKPKGLHVLYGVLPLLVALVAESLRAASAQMVLDHAGFESAQEVGGLSRSDQQEIVVAIVRREIGVMALAALVNVVLLARAAMTAG